MRILLLLLCLVCSSVVLGQVPEICNNGIDDDGDILIDCDDPDCLPGNFSDNGQALGRSWSLGFSLGDVDGDGDVDIVSANSSSDNLTIFINGGLNSGDWLVGP